MNSLLSSFFYLNYLVALLDDAVAELAVAAVASTFTAPE